MNSDSGKPTGVVVTGGLTANCLGIVRNFGRKGIPVILLDAELTSLARYSRYVTQRIECPEADESEDGFIGVLLDLGKRIDRKMVLISIRDGEALVLSKYKRELEHFYHVPVPEYDIVEKIVNKRSFYKLLEEMNVPHPVTWFPESLTELGQMGRDIAYPYIIKPSYSPDFQREYGLKCFVINSVQELERAIGRLEGKDMDVLIQGIIPGRRVYEFFTCLNGESEPLGVCGWDKIRCYPVGYGAGTFCESVWHKEAVETGLRFFNDIGYRGLAAPEFKRDPSDGEYKLLEVNPRVTLQHSLTTACGVDIPYLAYRDACGYQAGDIGTPRDGEIWVDDFVDLMPFLTHMKRREVGIGEIWKSLKLGKVHSVLCWDDPIPVIVRAINAAYSALRLIFQRLTGCR